MADPTGQIEERRKPATLATAVYEQLREDILSAALLPGDKLGMEVLRARYDVGGSPLREALNRLVAEGLVTQEDQKGFRVSSVSLRDLHELTHTRRLINEIALRESVRNGDAAWEERVLLAYHRMARAIQGGAPKVETEKCHREFHRALISGCGSSQLMQISQQLFEQARRYQMLSISRSARPRDAEREHRQIMAAALARDTELAVRLLNDHVNLTEKIVIEMDALPTFVERRPATKRQQRA